MIPPPPDKNPLSSWTDAQLVAGAQHGSTSRGTDIEMMRRLKESLGKSNRTMTILTVLICVCTVLLLIAASVQIGLQLKGCR